jgi:chloramphenicol 3-O-phosphotransferase
MSRMFILTGPPAAGKNTIAALYAGLVDRCAVIDVDKLRWIVVKPHVAPWGGEEGRRQHLLGVRNACGIAKNLAEEGFDVLILDVVSDEHAEFYKTNLAAACPRIIRLMPSYQEVVRRNQTRMPAHLKPDEIDLLYRMQVKLHTFDHSIDNTQILPAEIARRLLEW